MDYPMIQVTRKQILENIFIDTFKWVGPTNKPLKVDGQLFSQVGTKGFQYNLRVLDYDPLRDLYSLVRADGWHNILYPYYWLRYKQHNFLCLTKYRIIVTLMIWGIGYVAPGTRPEWRDILGKRNVK